MSPTRSAATTTMWIQEMLTFVYAQLEALHDFAPTGNSEVDRQFFTNNLSSTFYIGGTRALLGFPH